MNNTSHPFNTQHCHLTCSFTFLGCILSQTCSFRHLAHFCLTFRWTETSKDYLSPKRLYCRVIPFNNGISLDNFCARLYFIHQSQCFTLQVASYLSCPTYLPKAIHFYLKPSFEYKNPYAKDYSFLVMPAKWNSKISSWFSWKTTTFYSMYYGVTLNRLYCRHNFFSGNHALRSSRVLVS